MRTKLNTKRENLRQNSNVATLQTNLNAAQMKIMVLESQLKKANNDLWAEQIRVAKA